MCLDVVDRHPLDPVGQRVDHQAPCLPWIEVLGTSQDGPAVSYRLPLLLDLAHDGVDLGTQGVRPQDGLDVEVVEELARLGRVEDVAGLVDSELLQDDGQLLFQDLANPVLHRVLDDEVDGPHRVLLTDAVHPTDALFKSHRVPRDIVVDYHVAELQIQSLATRVGRHEDTGLLREGALDRRPLLHPHGAVEAHNREATVGEELLQHLLGWDELREDEHLQVGVTFLLLQAIDPVQQRLRLGIDTPLLRALGRLEEELHLGAFVLQRLQLGREQRVHLLLAVEIHPLLLGELGEEHELLARRLQRLKTTLQGGPDRTSRGGNQALHEDHQEANVALLLLHRLVVTLSHILSHRFVEGALLAVPLLPSYRHKSRASGLEERLSLGVDRATLLGPDHERLDALSGDAAGIGEGVLVDE